MAKKKGSKELKLNRQNVGQRVDKEMKKSGLTWTTIAGAIIVILGALAILFGLQGALEVFVGLVLVYFGLKMLGYHITI